ncbi:MAG: hypothetical protein U0457_05540 [Candidatus Sericytochromatia bacterium]
MCTRIGSPTSQTYDIGSNPKPKQPAVIKIADIDNNLSNEATSKEFKKQISSQMEIPEDKISVSQTKTGLVAKEVGSDKKIPIEFEDKSDFSKIAKMSAGSSALTLDFLGDEKNDKEVKMPNYEQGLTKAQAIERFKNDVARELKTEQRNIEILSADNQIVARKKGTDDRYILKFSDPRDGQRFLDYTNESPSRRLADFGIKKHEGEIRTGFSTNLSDPKHGTTLTTGITYGTFIGDHQRIIVDANFAQNPANKFSTETLQNFQIRYQNLDVPFLGEFGEVGVRYDNGKFKVDGKSDAIDVMANNMGKKYIEGIKEGDAKTIAMTAGAAALVGGALYIAKDKLPEAHDFDIPVKAKIYGNGANKINAIVAPTLTVGGGELKLGLHKAGVEAEQNIASGQNFRERVIYDFKDKAVEARVQANYNNLYVAAEGKYSKERPEQNNASLQVGYNQIISEKSSVNYYYAQNFNNDYKPTDTSINVNYSYHPSDKWAFYAGVGASRTGDSDKITPTASAGVSFRF